MNPPLPPEPPSTPFGNGWNEYRKLFLMYMEEEKRWRQITDKRLTQIEKQLAIFCSQKLMDKLEEIRDEESKHHQECALLNKRVGDLEEDRKLSRATQLKIWVALISGLIGLGAVILEKVIP